MRIHVIARNVTVGPFEMELIERCVEFALGRFASQVKKVEVCLDDLNGPRGGIDQRCRIDVWISPCIRKTVMGKGISVEAAVRQASSRITCIVRKDLARRRTRRIRAGRRVEVPALV